ncbi:hypothetical protein [Acinetobacter calcoaceticus]|uniref:hypothetical protein n=1 Tax=Acinetobacter calcoaceticus TaxID=471 RepID=UPI001E4CCB06|nr:hypothetical protein [Acinetobacter calcoaceticus]UGQ24681.1 hypothetical protein LRO55_09830 [Acinetobacter calcoaceticus]
MLKPIAIVVVVGVIGYKLLTKPHQHPVNETTLLINNAEKSVQEADKSIQEANTSFKKVPLSEYKTIDKGLQASQ